MPRCYFSIVVLLILVIFIKLEMMQNEKNSGYTGNFTNYSDWYRKVFLFRRYVFKYIHKRV